MTQPINWLAPWYAVAEHETQGGLEIELRREMCDTHVLAKEPAITLIGRRADTDDALFLLAGGRVAEVHLTWRQSTETDPRWPAAAVYASLEAWARESMQPLNAWMRETFGENFDD